MPPKRKTAPATDAPAPRRKLRKTDALSVGPPPVEPNPVAVRPTPSRRRGRPPKANSAAKTGTSLPPSPPKSSRTTRSSAAGNAAPRSRSTRSGASQPKVVYENEGSAADDEDELLLSPRKRASQLATPPRMSTPKSAGPRMILHSVEIVTPSRRMMDTSRSRGSPPASPSKSTAKGSTPRFPTTYHAPLRTPTPLHPDPVQIMSSEDILHPDRLPSGTPRQIVPIAGPSFRSKVARSPLPSHSASSVITFGTFDDRGFDEAESPENHTPHARILRSEPEADPSRPSSPTKHSTKTTSLATVPPASPVRLPHVLPSHLHPSLNAQKRAVLQAVQHMSEILDEGADSPSVNAIVSEQLNDLLRGTTTRGEGNSCLIIGPRGSGKTRIVDRSIASLPDKPIVIRLSGHAQLNDRVAIREIAFQLAQQTGNSFLPSDADADVPEEIVHPDNPFVDNAETVDTVITLPPPAHLLALISVIPTLPRPTIVVIDAFDLFATHARQSLLYCLLDTVQSCRTGKANKGIAVVGVTTRVDTLDLLEKRVKSRFSGRMLRTACPRQVAYWTSLSRTVLVPPATDTDEEWSDIWTASIEVFLRDKAVTELLEETFALTRDVQMLRRILISPVLELTPSSPYLSAAKLAAAIAAQRCPPRFPFLSTLPYPAICLLIACTHVQTSGHDVFTFEMLHEAFRDQVRTSLSAPVQVEGAGIGMVRCSRAVLFGAFEHLVTMRVFAAASSSSASTAREFVLHRCAIVRADVKKAVEAMGQTSLKKWFSKAQ